MWWCHFVHNRQLLVYLFCIASLAEVFNSCSLLHWHRVIQLGGHNRSQTRGQDLWVFLIERRRGGQSRNTGAAFLHRTPGFFNLWCEEGDEWSRYVCQILCRGVKGRRIDTQLSIIVSHRAMLSYAWFGRRLTDLMQVFIILTVIFCSDFLYSQLHADPAMTQNSSWLSATVTLVGT